MDTYKMENSSELLDQDQYQDKDQQWMLTEKYFMSVSSESYVEKYDREMMTWMWSPLDQFEEKAVFSLKNWVWTKSMLYEMLAMLILVWYMNLESTKNKWLLKSSKMVEKVMLGSISKTNVNQMKTKKYEPMMISVTMLILVENLIGNVSYSMATTSSMMVCFGLSLSLWWSQVIEMTKRHKWSSWSYFVPKGTPTMLVPLLSLIELVSYSSRSMSLGIRLFSNIVAGHTLMHLISWFMMKGMSMNWMLWLWLFPMMMYMGLMVLELSVSMIQSYVFLLLMSSYMKDSLDMH